MYEKSVQWNKLNLQSKAIYVSKQVHTIYRVAKLNFPIVLLSKFGVCIVQVCVLYSNCYGTQKNTAEIYKDNTKSEETVEW